MALVNFLKFSPDSGAIISDEEFWNVFFRKRMHGNTLHNLLTPELAEASGVRVVYGAVGYPSLQREVVDRTRVQLHEMLSKNDLTDRLRLKEVARLAFDQLQTVIRQKIDDKMIFQYGFSTDDLNRGYYMSRGEKVSISTEILKKKAKKLSSRETQDALMKQVMEAKAAIFGYDCDGITGYHLAGTQSIMGYVHEGFEAIGAGKYASGLVFGRDFKAKTLKMRQAGYDPAEGLFELIDSAFLAGEHFKEVGGNYNLIYINRKGRSLKDRCIEVFDNKARLATEIVHACKADCLVRSDAVQLLDKLILKAESFESVEKRLFKLSSDPESLHFVLRNYKHCEVREMVGGQQAGKNGKKSKTGAKK